MKLGIQIVLCSVIGGLAVNYGNNETTLPSDLTKYDSLCDICNSLSALNGDNYSACEDHHELNAFINCFCASTSPEQAELNLAPAISLVLLLLLSVLVIALIAVIIGWVLTCWTFKRRGRKDISSRNMTAATNTTQRTFQNCLYETSFIKENSTSNSAPQNQTSSGTIYNTIDKNEDNGLAYDVLRREKSTDHRQGRVVPENEDYSRLGLSGNDIERNYQLMDMENLGSKDKI